MSPFGRGIYISSSSRADIRFLHRDQRHTSTDQAPYFLTLGYGIGINVLLYD